MQIRFDGITNLEPSTHTSSNPDRRSLRITSSSIPSFVSGSGTSASPTSNSLSFTFFTRLHSPSPNSLPSFSTNDATIGTRSSRSTSISTLFPFDSNSTKTPSTRTNSSMITDFNALEGFISSITFNALLGRCT